MDNTLQKNRRNQLAEDPPFKGNRRGRGQKNARHHSHTNKPASDCPGGLQGHQETHRGNKKPV